MEWVKIFKIFNLRKLSSSVILYLFVMISVVIAVSISLSIPQIISEKEKYNSEYLEELNGAQLKIETPFISSSFQEKLDTLENEGIQINKSIVITTNIKNNSNRILCSLVMGDYALADDEVILSMGLANELEISEMDLVTLGNNTYKVKAIEKVGKGVDGQSETIGYGKVSSYNMANQMPTNLLIFIDCEDGESLKEELKKIEPDYKYSTTSDKFNSMQDELNMNTTTLNILNSMSCIMTILSIVSSIFMIIVQRQKDIAIMRMLSVRVKSIKKAMRLELYIMVFIPVLIGSFASILLARMMLNINGIVLDAVTKDISGIVISGFLLYLLIYFVFVKVATIAIEAISPLFVMRNDLLSWKKSKRKIIGLSILFMIITFVMYAIYLGKGSILISSIFIMIFILVFFTMTVISIKVVSHIPFKKNLLIYSIRNIKANRYSFIVIILSLTLTIWFLLIGFTLEKTIRDSYTIGVEQKVNYNYLVVNDNPEKLESAIKESPGVEGFTKLHRNMGMLFNDTDFLKSIQICEINQSEYDVKFNILEGEDIFEGSEKGVLISSEFSEQMKYKLGNLLKVDINGNVVEYKIKGIYDAGGINQNMILKPYEGLQDESILFLIKAENSEFEKKLENVSIMHISIMGMAIMKRINDFLLIFKWLCLICIFSCILFNLNIVHMSFINEYKEIAIIRALGLGKRFLYKNLALKFVTILISSILMSLGLYIIMMKLALTAIFKVNLVLSLSTIILPLGCAVILITAIFILPFSIIRNSKDFEVLREQV